MCLQVREVYAACRHLYYQHAVDRCGSYGTPNHYIEQKTVDVGYKCSHCSSAASYSSYSVPSYSYSDSGYYTGSSNRSYR